MHVARVETSASSPGARVRVRQALTVTIVLTSLPTAASAIELAPGVEVSSYLEAYFSGDPARPTDNTRQGPFYNFSRSNEVAVNLALVQLAFDRPGVRSRVGVMAGTYPQANLAAEPEGLRNIYEASLGVKLTDTHDIWLDAGIMPSHIGFESAVGADNWTLTRGIAAENSPYYMGGAKLGWTGPDGRWSAAAVLINGWQRMVRPDGVTLPSWGTQVTWTPAERIKVNWSTFSGYERPGRLRNFSNFFAQMPVGDRWDLTAGFDIGRESRASGERAGRWFSPALVARYRIDERSALGVRVERYSDPDGVIVSTGTPDGFDAVGASVNYDRQLREGVLWRVELRQVRNRAPIFLGADRMPSRNNLFVTTSLSVRF